MSKEDSDSSDSEQYDSEGAVKSNRISVKSNARSSVLVKINSIVAGYLQKDLCQSLVGRAGTSSSYQSQERL